MNAARQESNDQLGRIDILIDKAAVFTATPIVEIERADYHRVFNINVAGVVHGRRRV